MANIVIVKRPIKQWITVNGKHIPIYADADEDEKKKDAQIEMTKKEGDRLNAEKNPPKRLYLDDISAENANRATDILDLSTRKRYQFKSGTSLTNVYVFAGKGCSKEFRDAQKYANRYPSSSKDPKDWQHCAGIGYVTNDEDTLHCEIHWVQGKDGKVREAFIKEILE